MTENKSFNLSELFTDKLAKTDSPIQLNDLKVSCNYTSWETSVDQEYGDVFFFETKDKTGASLTVDEARKLVKYLEEWCYYVEDKDEQEREEV